MLVPPGPPATRDRDGRGRVIGAGGRPGPRRPGCHAESRASLIRVSDSRQGRARPLAVTEFSFVTFKSVTVPGPAVAQAGFGGAASPGSAAPPRTPSQVTGPEPAGLAAGSGPGPAGRTPDHERRHPPAARGQAGVTDRGGHGLA